MDGQHEMNDLMGTILNHLTDLKSDVGELKSDVAAVKEDIGQIRQFQVAQNGRVWELSKVVTAHISERNQTCPLVEPLKVALAKHEERTETNWKWFALLWAFVGSLIVGVGRLIAETFLGK